MESSKNIGHTIFTIFIKIVPLVFFLIIGLYFGIRIGEGRYDFYKPQSLYYTHAISDAHYDGYYEGYDEGHKDKQKEDYNSGWSAGYKFCLNENKAIRNDYDEGYDDGWESGYESGWINGYNEARDEFSDDY